MGGSELWGALCEHLEEINRVITGAHCIRFIYFQLWRHLSGMASGLPLDENGPPCYFPNFRDKQEVIEMNH